MELNARLNHESNEERRKDARVKIQIWAEERSKNATYFHLLSNLSSGGFFIQKKIPFPIGTIVQLELQLPGSDEKLPIKGQVLQNYQDPHSNNLGAGVKFIEIDKKIKKKIEKYLTDKGK